MDTASSKSNKSINQKITSLPLSTKRGTLGQASWQSRRTTGFLLLTTALQLLVSVVVCPPICHAWKLPSCISSSFRRQNRDRRCQMPCRQGINAEQPASSRLAAMPGRIPGQEMQDASLFPSHRPLLAIITETDACDSEERMNHTLEAIRQAVSSRKVDLVSVRLSLPPRNDNDGENDGYQRVLERATTLTEKLVELSSEQRNQIDDDDDDQAREGGKVKGSSSSAFFRVVCSSDLVSVAVRARAHGVHVKEHHLDRLPDIVGRFDYPIVVGTSTHSVESALRSSSGRLRPDYYFVGTCYLTASHPEKTRQDQLEGPELPGSVGRALSEQEGPGSQSAAPGQDQSVPRPRVLAIGGIDETNCFELVARGADGVAVIRAVLQADRPLEKVEEMQENMAKAAKDKSRNFTTN